MKIFSATFFTAVLYSINAAVTPADITAARKVLLSSKSTALQKKSALSCLKDGAENNLYDAVYWYAWMRFYGKGDMTADKKEAFKWFSKSADSGHPRGIYWVGYLYAKGEGVEKNPSLARDFMKKAADTGQVEQMRSFAYNCLSGRYFPKDMETAVTYYKKCADKNDPHSMYQLGYCYAYGKGVTRNLSKAFEYYCMAADRGDKDAQYRAAMASFFRRGTKRDDALVFKYLTMAAEQGHLKATYRLGNCYYFGFGVKQDFSKALEFYHQAAAKGEKESMVSIGYCYFRGFGVAKDIITARKWYEKAAAKKSVSAYLQLARIYFYGIGTEKDYEKSFHYYTLIGKSKNYQLKRISASEIALFYERGIVVPENNEKAFYYNNYAWSSEGRIKAGLALKNGIGTQKSPDKALEKFKKSADIDKSPLGAYYAAMMILEKPDLSQTECKEAMDFLIFAAKKQYVPAMQKLSEIYRTGSFNIQMDKKEAEKWHSEAEKTTVYPDEYFYGSAHL